MLFSVRNQFFREALCCGNWKCALMSATARSAVCFAAMVRTGLRGSLAATLVEIAYVSLTASAYAGMQQKALTLRSKLPGNFLIVVGVPGLAQALDWFVHRAAGAPVTGRALIAVSIFTAVSALFHLHVMRNGVFLSGRGHSPVDDFRRLPALIAGFAMKPLVLFAALGERMGFEAEG